MFLETYRSRIETGGLTPDPGQEAAARALDRLYGDVTRPPERFLLWKKKAPVRGVYLWGGVGRGKSMLMDMFFDSLPEGTAKRRVHFHDFMIETHAFLHRARQENTGKAEAAILQCARHIADGARVLCFDEFHVTDIADAMILGRLFTALFAHGVAVAATSNWPPDRLYDGGLQRDLFLPFIALLKERTEVVEVAGGPDYRMQCLRDGGVYFTPLGPESRRRADDAFSHLTGGAPPYSEILTVKGRRIEVPCVARGAARLSFSALCERPLGAEDYLAVARSYHTLFLEGVPVLRYDRRNEAKRLMTLIDALYDNRTVLVVTADALPERLYQGHDHSFEFQRTVSRLIEMQGRDYIAAASR